MRIDKLRRLVRVTQLLYRQESAELARLRSEQLSLVELMESATNRLDAEETTAFDAGLVIAWAARRRRELSRADANLAAQLKTAGSALASFKGAETRLSIEHGRSERAAEQFLLEQVIENAVRPGSRFRQDAIYNIEEEGAPALLSPRGVRSALLRPAEKDGPEE